jgi:hypothetical protein
MPSFPLSYPINPRLQPKSIQFTNKTLTAQFRSSYSAQSQTHRYGGQWFELNVTLPTLFQSDAEEMTAFLNALGGNSGTFTFKLPSKFMTTSGSVGLTTTTTGNDFTVGSGTVQVGKYGYTSSSGRLIQYTTATSLFPKLDPSTAYTINTTTGTKMRLVGSDISYSVDEMMMYGVSIGMIEAI